MMRWPSGRRSLMLFALLLFVVSVALLGTSVSAGAAPVDDKKEELKDLKGRIESLRRDLSQAEESKHYAADQLRETETAISDTNRRLHELVSERSQVQGELGELETQTQRLGQQTLGQQQQLARLLNRQFVGGDSEALKLILSGRDPDQSARDQYFLTRLSQAKADLIAQLRSSAAEKKRLANDARERQEKLKEIERRAQDNRNQLLERKKQRQAKLDSLADRIKAQRREIDTLRRDEQRLGNLIAGLAQIAAARRKAQLAQQTQQALQAQKAAAAAASSSTEPKVGAGGTAPSRPVTVKSRPSSVRDHDPGVVSGAFAALRGKLRLPVRGELAGRFGQPRAEGGTSWKGLFIRAAEGLEVRAVAAGTVVFADWLRGFGNLLVIDHGDDFLSVYGNNESLLAAVGSTVKSGDSVATIGNSGGNQDSGLYFELRHRGQAFDPLKWAGGR